MCSKVILLNDLLKVIERQNVPQDLVSPMALHSYFKSRSAKLDSETASQQDKAINASETEHHDSGGADTRRALNLKIGNQFQFKNQQLRILNTQYHTQKIVRYKLSDELMSVVKRYMDSIEKDQKQSISRLNKKILGQQRFLNMVIHDLRNPSESIHQGMK